MFKRRSLAGCENRVRLPVSPRFPSVIRNGPVSGGGTAPLEHTRSWTYDNWIKECTGLSTGNTIEYARERWVG